MFNEKGRKDPSVPSYWRALLVSLPISSLESTNQYHNEREVLGLALGQHVSSPHSPVTIDDREAMRSHAFNIHGWTIPDNQQDRTDLEIINAQTPAFQLQAANAVAQAKVNGRPAYRSSLEFTKQELDIEATGKVNIDGDSQDCTKVLIIGYTTMNVITTPVLKHPYLKDPPGKKKQEAFGIEVPSVPGPALE